MTWDLRKIAGVLVFIGTAQFAIFGLLVAEAVYPKYSVSQNVISDLGVGPTAWIFNISIMIVGATILATPILLRFTYLQGKFPRNVVPVIFAAAGAAAIGVGVFPKTDPTPHTLFAFLAFVFAALSAIATFKVVRPPVNYLSAVLGAISLVALGLFATETSLGLGIGGMERMIVYPVLVWGMTLGGYLMAAPEPVSPPSLALPQP